jgi:phage terminase Nu1 subunit (DNA packaging protein)
MIDLSYRPTQTEFAALVGISQPAVSGLLARGIILEGGTIGQWSAAYCDHLREQAAGRAAAGDLDLAGERARLAKEQADKVAMQNAVSRGELAPVAAMESVLAAVGARVGKILDTIPGLVRRRVPGIPAPVLDLIAADIAKCRNMAAAMTLDDLMRDDEAADDDERDEVPVTPFAEQADSASL